MKHVWMVMTWVVKEEQGYDVCEYVIFRCPKKGRAALDLPRQQELPGTRGNTRHMPQ